MVKEKGTISEEGIELIARASEGSVRDAISLLDRSLIIQSLNDGKEVSQNQIREMLGLADRQKMITLFEAVINGEEQKALNELKSLINFGLDTKNFLNDMLELIYLCSRVSSLGEIKNDKLLSESELELISKISKNISTQDLSIFWQLTIKTIEDLKILNNENVGLEMYLIQLMHIKKKFLKYHSQNQIMKISWNQMFQREN